MNLCCLNFPGPYSSAFSLDQGGSLELGAGNLVANAVGANAILSLLNFFSSTHAVVADARVIVTVRPFHNLILSYLSLFLLYFKRYWVAATPYIDFHFGTGATQVPSNESVHIFELNLQSFQLIE